MRSFGKKSHLCRRDGAFFGKKSHPCGRACVFFWVENALMRNGWRALSGKIFHPCERADTIFWEEISRLQVSLRVLSRKKSHPCRRVARAFGNDMALFERGRQDACRPFLRSALKQTAFRISERGRRLGAPLSACQKTCCQIAICINAEFIYTATGSPARVLREKRPTGHFPTPPALILNRISFSSEDDGALPLDPVAI